MNIMGLLSDLAHLAIIIGICVLVGRAMLSDDEDLG
jgi:hypothetical protein